MSDTIIEPAPNSSVSAEHAMDTGRRVSRGIGFAVIGRLLSTLCQGAASILLGRILGVSDFGLINFCWIVIGFASYFNDAGIESAVIQKRSADPKTLRTAFTLKLGLSLSLMLLLWILSPKIAEILGTANAAPVLRLLSVTFGISAFAFPPSIRLRQSLRYDAIAQIWVLSTLAGALSTIVLALAGMGYWSIALGHVISSLVTFVVAQWHQPSSLKLGFDVAESRMLLSFGGRVFLSALLAFGCFNVDNFMIGLTLGVAALGVYGVAFNWATQICTFVSSTVGHALFPAFADMRGNPDKISSLYLRSLAQLGLAGAVGYGLFVLLAPEFLILILGAGTQKWIAAVPVLQVLCVYGIFRQLLEPLGNVLLALGRADLMVHSTAIVFVSETLGVGAVLWFGLGLVHVAWVVLIAYVLQYFYYFSRLPGHLGLAVPTVLRHMLPSTGTVLAMAALSILWPATPTWGSLVIKALVGFPFVLISYGCLGGYEHIRFAIRTLGRNSAGLFPSPSRVS
jgi:lipopolysaccharide exporter